MGRLVTGGAAVLLAASGCVMLEKVMDKGKDTGTPTASTKTAVAGDWPSTLPGRIHIAEGVYAVTAMGMENVLWYDNYYYKLTFSIWYRSAMPRGGWMQVSTVPSAFRSIPRGHAKYHMVKHVPAP